jgi:putative ABC transport system ATP-binding protein
MIPTQGLRYCYSDGPTLNFPDVNVPQGTILLLSGPSGCGKSTWLALAAALMAPTAGEFRVANQSVNAPKKVASDVWRVRAIGLAIAQTLQVLGVADLSERLPAQLSGGQAQRAGFFSQI